MTLSGGPAEFLYIRDTFIDSFKALNFFQDWSVPQMTGGILVRVALEGFFFTVTRTRARIRLIKGNRLITFSFLYISFTTLLYVVCTRQSPGIRLL